MRSCACVGSYTSLSSGSLGGGGGAALLGVIEGAAFEPVDTWPQEDREAWAAWLAAYWGKVRTDGRPDGERLTEMRGANPAIILRNWMAKEAYEAAAGGDYATVRELLDVLRKPYDEQGGALDQRWGGLTPQWARGKAGLAFMS
mmetsp:Transcript_7330/g.19093  ORF Transcript_7330/g.19093 Transcript_7330/m.19093 type:complete len:144 (+) Transcript_7330:615-1046(+)